jgi:hypothetical protein
VRRQRRPLTVSSEGHSPHPLCPEAGSADGFPFAALKGGAGLLCSQRLMEVVMHQALPEAGLADGFPSAALEVQAM